MEKHTLSVFGLHFMYNTGIKNLHIKYLLTNIEW